jgi:hypothetical protein
MKKTLAIALVLSTCAAGQTPAVPAACGPAGAKFRVVAGKIATSQATTRRRESPDLRAW